MNFRFLAMIMFYINHAWIKKLPFVLSGGLALTLVGDSVFEKISGALYIGVSN